MKGPASSDAKFPEILGTEKYDKENEFFPGKFENIGIIALTNIIKP